MFNFINSSGLLNKPSKIEKEKIELLILKFNSNEKLKIIKKNLKTLRDQYIGHIDDNPRNITLSMIDIEILIKDSRVLINEI